MTMKDMFFTFVTTTIALFVANIDVVDAIWLPWGNSVSDEAVSLNELQSFWVDAIDVVDDLDNYEKLWIKPHSCVWSECAVDDTDDNYMGDNRDGDEQWYQYRTQGFCANAAYSLYGRKKDDKFFTSLFGCTRRHFINSFFTYGGADNLLKSIGESPIVYSYDNDNDDDGDNDNDNDNDNNDGNNNDGADDDNDDNYDNNDDGGDDDDNDEYYTNVDCVEIEYDGSDDYIGNYDEEDNSDANSGSNDNDEYSGTLGCSADGKYVIASFQSSSCDGNYFSGIVDDFEDYNKQHDEIGCHKIYEIDDEVSVENVIILLNNSWSCDLRLYPNGCPDPYGEKERFGFAMRTVAHGGNPRRAYLNMVLKTPINITTWTLMAITITIFVMTYLVKNQSRAIRSKGGKNLMGYLRCLAEDIAIGCRQFGSWTALKWSSFVKSLTKNDSKQDFKPSSEKYLSDGNDDEDSNDEHSADTYINVDDDVENKFGNNKVDVK